MYDFVIIGAGPSGLAFAQICSSLNKSVLIIDNKNSIGGCHRVDRKLYVNKFGEQEYLFVEHSPRLYFSNYLTTQVVLQKIGINFKDIFNKSKWESSNALQNRFLKMSIKELFFITITFIIYIFNNNFGRNISMKDFTDKSGFTDESKYLIDNFCRLTDGGSSEQYTLNEFFSAIDFTAFSQIYQPKLPNDISLFYLWRQKLEKNNVKFLLNTNVLKIDQQLISNKITSITVDNNEKIFGKNFIFAIPPTNLTKILSNTYNDSIKNCFGNFLDLTKFANDTKYLYYIPVIFHFDTKINLDEEIKTFDKAGWGIDYNILTNDMKFKEQSSKTVISAVICYPDNKSKFNNKTTHECTKQEIIEETFLYLKELYPNLPKQTVAFVSDHIVRDNATNKWITYDTPFVMTANEPFLKASSETIDNIYTLGTHNGNHLSGFRGTTMESAIVNAVYFAHELFPESKNIYKIKSNKGISFFTRIILLFIIIRMITKRL